MVDSPIAGAESPTVTTSSGSARSSVRSAVMIFVMLAIGRRRSASRAYRTSPLEASATSTARALTAGGSSARAGATKARASAARSDRRSAGRRTASSL
jgi:hypothetical protein